MQGIAVFIEEVNVDAIGGDLDLGRLTGEAIRLVRDSILQGFLDWSPRILLAMYSCEIQASSEFLSCQLDNSPTATETSLFLSARFSFPLFFTYTSSSHGTDNILKKNSRSPRPRLRRNNSTPRPNPL